MEMHADTSGAKLAKMANQIGAFFDAQPDAAAATLGVANHLKLFWAPVMRRELVVRVKRGEDLGLEPIVLDAIHRYHEVLLDPYKHLPGEASQFGPRGGSDAG